MLRAQAAVSLAALAAVSEETKPVTCLAHDGERRDYGAENNGNMTCDGMENISGLLREDDYREQLIGGCARWKTVIKKGPKKGIREVTSGCDNFACANYVGEGQRCCVMNRGKEDEKKIECYPGDFNGDGWYWKPDHTGTPHSSLGILNYSALNATFDDKDWCEEDCDPSGCGVTGKSKCTIMGEKILGVHRDSDKGQTINAGNKNKGSNCWWYTENDKSHPTAGCDDTWCDVLVQRDVCCKMLYRNWHIFCSSKGTFGANPTKANFTDCNRSCITKFRHDFGKHFVSAAGSLRALTSLAASMLISSGL